MILRKFSCVCCCTILLKFLNFSAVQFSSVAQLSPTLCDPMDRITPGFPVHHQHLKLVQTHVHRVSDAVQPSHLLPSPFPPAFFPRIKIFSNESVLHIRWPNYWSFNFSISPSHEYSALTSMRLRQNKPLEFRFSPAEKVG